MDTLTNLDRDIPKLVSEHINLFDSFENVYLLGSILKPEMVHNDIDILAIYINYSNRINNDILMILDELEKASVFIKDFINRFQLLFGKHLHVRFPFRHALAFVVIVNIFVSQCHAAVCHKLAHHPVFFIFVYQCPVLYF